MNISQSLAKEQKDLKDKIARIVNEKFANFGKARSSILNSGFSQKYLYGSLALEEAYNKFKDIDYPLYHQEYIPNPYYYQYDIELYIFINFKELLKREFELEKNENKIKLLQETGSPTLLPRERHIANAATIRWPVRAAPDGSFIGDLAITPWLMDYFYGVSNYNNVIEFGGAGQGKTYGPLAFMSMIYDYFIYTQKGAQCTFSTVSESKLSGSTWPYINRLYEVKHKERHPFSLTAGKAKKCGDFTYNRVKPDGKVLDQGGTLKGVLIPRGRKDASVVDKLTGFHDPEARIYLLDEMQSTDDAPLGAYTNMFLHPKHGWFNAAGNFDLDGDLLGINVEPSAGWDAVNEKTHMWESTLKTTRESLGHKSLIIHFNNDISPGMTDSEFGRKYHRFVPTVDKKNKTYPTPESRETIAYKRFWIGFRYEKDLEKKVKVLTLDVIEGTRCYEAAPIDYTKEFTLASFDSAPASVDRNILTMADIGTTQDGLPMINLKPGYIRLFKKPGKDLEYYTITCDKIIESQSLFGVQPGHLIMDWTARPAHIEMLAQRGYPCHHLIYQEKIPDKPGINKVTGAKEDRIPLESIATYVKADAQKQIINYADQAVANKITLGAYVFRMFVDAGRIRGLNSSLLTGIECNSFEKEFLTRDFLVKKRNAGGEVLTLDSKDGFKKSYGFSPDVLDTLFQMFYMIYVIYGVRPHVAGLGSLRRKEKNKRVDNYENLWKSKRNIKL